MIDLLLAGNTQPHTVPTSPEMEMHQLQWKHLIIKTNLVRLIAFVLLRCVSCLHDQGCPALRFWRE